MSRPDQDGSGKFKSKLDFEKARAIYSPDRPWTENESRIAKAFEMIPRAVRNHKEALETVPV